ALTATADERCSVLCRWAGAEFKGKETARAEELLGQARGCAAGPLFVAYVLLSESGRLRLPAPVKKRFDQEFNAGLAAGPTGAEAAAVASWCASVSRGDGYHGLKTHAKKIIAYAERAGAARCSEEQLARLGEALLELGSVRITRRFLELGQR